MDAVRHFGCTANDYIQWFSASNYETAFKDEPYDVIAEVDFCHKFDILDVLAICWSIHQNPCTGVYTLQRFNCYFLCGTIISILARRLTRWEACFTRNVWMDTLHQTLDQLTRVPYGPKTKHLILHVCNLLDPDSPNPAEFIFSALRSELEVEDAYRSLRKALAGTLWRTAWSGYMSRALVDHVNAAVGSAIEGNGTSAQAFKSATSDPRQVLRERIESFKTVNDIVAEKAVGALSDGTASLEQAFHAHYRMENIEYRRPISRELCISAAAHVLGAFFPLQIALNRSTMDEWGFKDVFLRNPRGVLTAQRVGAMLAKRRLGVDRATESTILVGRTISIDTAVTASDVVARLNCEMADRSLRETLVELREKDKLTHPNITAALHIVLTKNLWDAWLNRSVLELLTANLPEMLEEVKDGKIEVKVIDPDKGDQLELNTVVKLHEHVIQRITAHANRVQAYHIAAAPLVSQDIQNGMSDVWRSLPDGFGSGILSE
ncbi:hypothetical protein FRC08_005145 [Ceratobasidium sp. 394]|nr:hypothetical protein FRC08_005145 [Ceratobasidium sp. 394]